MKTSTIVTLAAVVGGVYVLSQLAKPQPLSGSDILEPSPDDGKWITESGSLYGMDGWGSFKRKFSKVTNRAVHQVKAVAKKVGPIAAGGVMLAPIFIAKAVRGAKKPSEAPAGAAVEYQDENGKVITEAQYNALVAAQNTQPVYTPPPSTANTAAAMATDPYAKHLTADQGGGGGSGFKASDYSEEGSTSMPLQPQSIQTPSADILPAQPEYAPEYAQEEPPKVGVLPWLVGGGLLAAVAVAAS